MQIDVELALINASSNNIKYLQSHLPTEFYIEDRSDRGWGIVIRTTQKSFDDFSATINNFLEPLNPLIEIISNSGGILRVGVFYSTVTCTIRLNYYEQLAIFRLPIEISTYPSFDEEE